MKFVAVIYLLYLSSNVIGSPRRKRGSCGLTSYDCYDTMIPGVKLGVKVGAEQYSGIVKFYLYNNNLIDGSEGYSVFDTIGLEKVFNKFEPKNETKIIIHGWMDNLNSSINVLFKDGYLKNYGYNVIITDWSDAGSMSPVYPAARAMVPIISNQLAMLIDNLYVQFNLKPEKLHLIGHSLGAHIAGITGKNLQIGIVGRVTGLDPAGPLFSMDKPEERISNSSALFVDVVHTCGGFLGATFPMGHADFFPNDGRWIQPGCWADLDGVCSHARSYLYFTESIQYPFGYQSTLCSDWAQFVENKCGEQETIAMGAFVPNTARGLYYLKTNSEPPFFEL